MTLEDRYREEITNLFASIKQNIIDKIDEEAAPEEKATWKGYLGGLKLALRAMDNAAAKPVGNPDRLTLMELARELRKIFRVKYLTVSPDFCGCPAEIYCWTSIRPAYNAKGRMWIISQEGSQTIACSFEAWHLEKSLDLSEYADENGEIDYSRCIVEVEE